MAQRAHGASETGFELRFRSEERFADLGFLAVFESGGRSHIYIERGALRWRAVLRLTPDGEGSFALEALRGGEWLRVLEDAFKSTAAYSAERQTHYRIVGGDRLQAW